MGAGLSAGKAKGNNSVRLALALTLVLICLAGLYWSLTRSGPADETASAASAQAKIVPLFDGDALEVLYQVTPAPTRLSLNLPEAFLDSIEVVEDADHVRAVVENGTITLVGERPILLTSLRLRADMATPEKAYPLVQYGTGAAAYDASRFAITAIDGWTVREQIPGTRFEWVPANEVTRTDRRRLSGGHMIVLDDGLGPDKDWIAGSAATFFDRFGSVLPDFPQSELMVLITDGPDGTIRVEGDTVPGQVLIKIGLPSGTRFEDPAFRESYLRLLAHELVHLWQLSRPGVSSSPDWLHEGGAEAFAVENMFFSGLSTEIDYITALKAQERQCAAQITGGRLVSAPSRGHHRASYACGALIWAALSAQRADATVSDAWLAFHDAEPVPDEAAFLRFAEDWTGDPDFARSVRKFLNADWSGADGGQVIEGLYNGTL